MALGSMLKNGFVNILQGKFDTFKYISLEYGLFIFLLVMLYIINSHCVDRYFRNIAELTYEVKQLRYEDITKSAELVNMSKQSEVLRRVTDEGLRLKELDEPPRVVYK